MTDDAGEADEMVLEHLLKSCDGRVRPASPSDAVAGVPARFVASPASTQEVAELLRAAAEDGLRVVARGAGTKQSWGLPPAGVDLVVETTAMTGVVEHAAGDLIAVTAAGTPLADLQAVVAEAGQQLALDDPLPAPAGSTLGGAVAANTSGPRRLLYGTLRDLVIGITFVRADGGVAKAGGKVVKNVAGYDFGKLLTGSFGTLGIITEIATRLHPLPPARRTVTRVFADGAAAARGAAAVLRSQAVPAAVELDQALDGAAAVAVLLEGVTAGLERRAAGVAELLDADAATAHDPPGWFGVHPFGAGDVGLKITSSLTGVGPVLGSLRELGDTHGTAIRARGSAAGVLYAGLPADTDADAAAAVVADLRTVAATYSGGVVVLTAPPAVRDALDVWGPVPGLDLMRRLKHQLDPGHRLAPGRFVGGI